MAYQAKRNKTYEEEFQLTEADGRVVHTLHISLDADNMVRKLSEKYLALVHALKQVQGVSRASSEEELLNGLEILGNAVSDMLEAVFGPEDAETIIAFYENRYLEMCQEVVPFITEVVIPRVRKISQENRKAVLAGYGKNKRQKA